MGSPRAETVCKLVEALDAEARRRMIEIVIESGYSEKEVAEMAGVTLAAVSRYVKGTLSPAPQTLCRLILSLDEELATTLLAYASRELWRLIREVIEGLPHNVAKELLEEVADEVAEALTRLS